MKKTRAWLQKVRLSYDKTQQQVANEAGIKRGLIHDDRKRNSHA
jgi:DNA-binding XRE family transcriptional regulator